jgi:hypothetical protein
MCRPIATILGGTLYYYGYMDMGKRAMKMSDKSYM